MKNKIKKKFIVNLFLLLLYIYSFIFLSIPFLICCYLNNDIWQEFIYIYTMMKMG